MPADEPLKPPATHRGFEPEDIDRLREAFNWAAGLANRDCDCDWSDKSQCDPCDVCQARKVIELLDKVLDPKIEGLHPSRMANPPERIYIELFREKCKRVTGLNHGYGLLELLLRPEGVERPPHIMQRDAHVAATVIQWLGTNGGMSFMHEAEKQIRAEEATRREFGLDGYAGTPASWQEQNEQGERWQIADVIAKRFLSIDKHPGAVQCLRTAILNAIIAFQRIARGGRPIIPDTQRAFEWEPEPDKTCHE